MRVEERWRAVVRRDTGADGLFFYSVKTTGVYCRPSCGSRLPRRENVAFFDSCAAAEKAGFRPCKRCLPRHAVPAERIAAACRTIERSEQEPTLENLAREARMSPFHFHRQFKELTGVTPKAYAKACRGNSVRAALSKEQTVTTAIYAAGYNSSGRFYANSKSLLGMTPKQFRSGAGNETIRFAVGECSLGSILVAATDKGICAITLSEDPNELVQHLQDSFPKAQLIAGDKQFERLVAEVIGFVEEPIQNFALPLDIRGTAFQQKVWDALCKIPFGTTTNYSALARNIGAPKSVRAVASACGANRIAVAIPCHRVVRLNGDLSGYRWGVERKRKLLERERRRI
jgi:AraC family transcriptional regulator, regulatory protein of adaptative response / methylated-DNA-[protein]-cysteine methyltransferase